ncbi:MAG: kinase/pyrophosphorylase [Calditrichota bacterium]|jgi:[pyruvate, water dikinase]-phosphate phosphotransferase / [pyruvate, water dikinase] kinase
MNYVFVVSDGTGGTAERALNAAMTQFESTQVQIELRPGVRSEDQVKQIVEEAAKVKGIIIHTLVSDEIRHYLIRMSRLHNVENIDIMGPLLSRLSQQFSVTPSQKPGLFRQLNEDYFRRIETMEFALKHDDGQRINELKQAEIVLVGVSRTFKTPLSVYLAFKRWFVANVPIILDMEPPAILSEIPPDRVFGLTMDTRRLATLRRIRDEYLGGQTGEYSSLDYVRREVLYALRVFENPPRWQVINVTGKPIEEIASEIIALAQPRDVSID